MKRPHTQGQSPPPRRGGELATETPIVVPTTVTDSESMAEHAALDLALRHSQAAKQKVDAVADDLGTTNKAMKRGLSKGVVTVPAEQSLHVGERIESTVKEVAEDLHEVNGVLSKGIDQLQTTETALVQAEAVLVRTQAALVSARHDEDVSRQRALHDSATGLPNRELFDDRTTQAIAMAERHGWILAVLFIDLDGFKQINDVHGHATGDAVLKEVARRLALNARDEDTVCRSGGDEFLVLLINPEGTGTAERLARDILALIAEPIDAGGRHLSVAASIGIARFPEHATHGPELVAHADAAMYQAKRSGGGVSAAWTADAPGSAQIQDVPTTLPGDKSPQKSRSSAPQSQSSMGPMRT